MLAERLVKLRKENNYTQQRVADFLGITRPAYTAYERGTRQPDYDILTKLADFYDVSVDYLLGRTDDPEPSKMDKLRKLGLKEGEEIHFFDLEGLTDEDIEFIKNQIEFLQKKAKQLRKDTE
ncbi:XRE family transcriptional regulator [Bacillus methanolicus]|nr:XRE family transcriptional regulator [Bacillus methanolicus]